ncbi:MAG: 1,4-dihydroxy-2-naphthoate polyprenyltransferase [Aerococcaceae bacterium]|nr:1,4-dihydroxy-2-naphthoate polyprenyltransferase [Aerococcaceae bacterium]
MMQKVKIFLEFVELRTKVASFFPMIIGFLWTIYYTGTLNLLNTCLFFCAVITFDMCTTAINNTMDYHKAIDLNYKTQENIIGVHQLSFPKMVRIVFILLAISLCFSLLLVFRTDALLLGMGAICFIIGITYTFGPMPLSRLPLGEVFSGFTMGFGIFFLANYMTSYDQLLTSAWSLENVVVSFNWLETLRLFGLSLPLVSLIANIMLANNTCDLKTDIQNQRYTLVYYIGVKNALLLYQTLSIVPWIAWTIYLLTGTLPLWAALGFLLMYPHWKSVQRFCQKQEKRETFIESVKSFVWFSSLYAGVLVVAILTSK